MMLSTSRLPAIHLMGFLLLLTLVAGAGCASKKRPTIHGTVTFKGAPVSVGAIYFHSADDQVAMGNLNTDGTFTATDIPLGEVRVSLQVRDPGAYSREMQGAINNPMGKPKGGASPGVTSIPPKYADPNTSGLKYSIDATTQEIEVKLE